MGCPGWGPFTLWFFGDAGVAGLAAMLGGLISSQWYYTGVPGQAVLAREPLLSTVGMGCFEVYHARLMQDCSLDSFSGALVSKGNWRVYFEGAGGMIRASCLGVVETRDI